MRSWIVHMHSWILCMRSWIVRMHSWIVRMHSSAYTYQHACTVQIYGNLAILKHAEKSELQ